MASQADIDEVKSKVEALARKRYGDASPASLKRLFAAYDADGNGLGSDREIAKLLDDAGVTITALGFKVGNLRVARAVIEEMDKDANEAISWDEYSAYMKLKAPKAADSTVTTTTSSKSPTVFFTAESPRKSALPFVIAGVAYTIWYSVRSPH
jgi:hypothetical protein